MRLLSLTVAIGCLVLHAAPIAAQTAPDDSAVLRARIAAHQVASETGDLRGLVDIYALDAQTIAGNGTVSRGRDAIEADYRRTLASASTKSGRHHTHPPESIAIEFVTPDVALIEVDSVNVGGTDAAGAPVANARSRLMTIWRKQKGEWLVVYQRVLPASPK